FLLMEMIGIGGPLMEVVLIPGLLAAGIGSLTFVGLDNLTGFGQFTLKIPDIPTAGTPTGAEFLWAIVIGIAGAIASTAVFWLARACRPLVEPRRLWA